eukprot:CAMPEP_0179207108 /NCGR_PEP_ID=MMETSP0796-20121207/103271_1 /TAXON_ID=73915 /ORGANISM="Pyrodinium bahamense, Strain pbaha01" /LENGTH=169 /DNA_ID=CAMNT_0020912031 /DNA_START=591 /DNA_END=1099 /DNA_ORIENTATION=-
MARADARAVRPMAGSISESGALAVAAADPVVPSAAGCRITAVHQPLTAAAWGIHEAVGAPAVVWSDCHPGGRTAVQGGLPLRVPTAAPNGRMAADGGCPLPASAVGTVLESALSGKSLPPPSNRSAKGLGRSLGTQPAPTALGGAQLLMPLGGDLLTLPTAPGDPIGRP